MNTNFSIPRTIRDEERFSNIVDFVVVVVVVSTTEKQQSAIPRKASFIILIKMKEDTSRKIKANII